MPDNEINKLSDFDKGFIIGILVGEGHFGGDGKQPQITLRMHIRHEPLFRWLQKKIPGAHLYGPYNHGGREYYQLMVRGNALKGFVGTLLQHTAWKDIDPHAFERFSSMMEIYNVTPKIT